MQAVVKILADCGIIRDDATQVSEVFHCVYVSAIDADVRRMYATRGWRWYNAPQWGAADAEIKVPSDENTELKRSPFKAWSR